MTNLRLSIHSSEHLWLRDIFLKQRKALGLSQRALCEKMGVVSSFVGKVETGDRRLDVFEFIAYCEALELNPIGIVTQIKEKFR
ncbi:transcriptional regulator [Rodentibacter trehalosifermentans]|uniref:Transcriptional regulator n=2 Tax=Rodentibacter TaxID=1960084 RepID=A0A1V3IJM1_9PAST|nr:MULTISPECIES: helix-turn-helix transcriptional regulator [Rodentibacter]OOF41498.1 transcriptional regulator [Rodentibacter rarus]OOF43813.1 transcriptional regulator [Rodentibacter trehalosifermentans]OOF45135.1 transcriptional regulator [Rodentibacter trehalosifermentans]